MIKRGEIYFVDLNPIKGREQAGRRPVLVVSVDAINKQPLVVTVVVGTSGENVQKDYPVNVRVPASVSGLSEDTVFMCFQIRSIDPARFVNPKSQLATPSGFMPKEWMARVEESLRLVLGI
jgi:mRNA interferase MazF